MSLTTHEATAVNDTQVDLAPLSPEAAITLIRATEQYGALHDEKLAEKTVRDLRAVSAAVVRASMPGHDLPSLREARELDKKIDTKHYRQLTDEQTVGNGTVAGVIDEYHWVENWPEKTSLPIDELNFAAKCIISGIVRDPDPANRRQYRDTLTSIDLPKVA